MTLQEVAGDLSTFKSVKLRLGKFSIVFTTHGLPIGTEKYQLTDAHSSNHISLAALAHTVLTEKLTPVAREGIPIAMLRVTNEEGLQ